MPSCSKGVALLTLGVLPPLSVFGADVVRLSNGDVISGRLISYQDGVCIFDTKYGVAARLNAKEIVALSTDDAYQITFASDEKIAGRFVYEQGRTTLQSVTFGSVNVEMATVRSLIRNFAGDKNKNAGNSSGTGTPIGEEDVKEPPLAFLTGSTVLLASGKYELDLGFAYKHSRESSSLPAAGYFQQSAYSARQAMFDVTLRGGLYEGLEGWVSVPFSYSYVEQVSTNAYVRETSSSRVGDVSFGLQYQLLNEDANIPAVSASVAVTAPTGRMRYHDLADTWKDPINNGSGYWGISPGLSFTRTIDPAILFGGINYSYAFRRTIDGYKVKPGWGAGFYFGVGYALNENLSVGTRLSYAYLSRMELDGEEIYGSDKDPMELAFSASYRFADKWIVTPLVSFNLNRDAGLPSIGLRLKRQLN